MTLLIPLIFVEGVINITIFAISNLEAHGGKSAVGGQWLAVREINNNKELLPNYNVNLEVFNSGSHSQTALLDALNVTKHKSTKNDIYFPLILGAPWSSLSTAINPVLGTFKMGQISAGATSISLSDTNRYPYFYRTIPSDALQAEGLMLLCNTFNWTSIAVVYVTDVYGLHLSLGIQQLATKYDIDVTSIAVSYEDSTTYNYAAKQIKDLGVYIIILIIHSNASPFIAFENEGMLGYPYFYLGVDAWFDSSSIKDWRLKSNTSKIGGFIGTVPWQTHSLHVNAYTDDIKNVVNDSMTKYNEILESWKNLYHNGYNDKLYFETPGINMIYGYDAMYTIVYAIQQIGDDLLDLIGDESVLIEKLNDIITNEEKMNFIGASGHVIYDEKGDRIDGFYSFANVLNNGNVEYFGYFYEDNNGSIQYQFEIDKIVWPKYFTSKGMIPRSDILIYKEMETINWSISISMMILLCISCILSMIYMMFLICFRRNIIIKAASWRLNIIMCFGSILLYISGILYGIDESFLLNKSESIFVLDLLCNIRLWLIMISYTLLFIPLFMKTYRLSRMFKAILTKKVVKDKRLFIVIIICVSVDIVLLTIFTFILPLKRVYHDGEIKIIDELQEIQYIHGLCGFGEYYSNDYNNWSIYGFLLFFKLCELIWGLWVAFDVSRIKDITNMLTKFDETGIQILSILFTFIILCIAIPIFSFGPIHKPNFYYLIIIIIILLIGNIILTLNLSPRIFAVIVGNEQKYALSPIHRIEAILKKQLSRHLVVDNNIDINNTCNPPQHLSIQYTTSSPSELTRDQSKISNI